MSAHLKKLLESPALEEAVLLTHPNTIDKEVTWIYLGESLPKIWNIEPWIKPGDLLFLIGHFIDLGHYDLKDVIDLCHKMNLSGIILFESDYIFPLKNEDIERCNTYNLPLIKIPWRLSYNEISKELLTLITANESITKSNSELLNSILFSAQSELNHHPTDFTHSKLSLHNSNAVMICQLHIPADCKKLMNTLDIDALNTYFASITTQILKANEIPYISLERLNEVIVLVPQDHLNELTTMNFQNLANDLLKKKYSRLSISIGIGSPYEQHPHYKKSYREASYVIKAKSLELVASTICEYRSLDFLRIIFEMENNDMIKRLYPNKLKELIAHDHSNYGPLMKTLESYLKNNRSVGEASKELFVHKNTVTYRIDKIKHITGFDFEQKDLDFILLSEIHICKYLNAIQ